MGKWTQANGHLPEGQRVALVLLSLKGTPNTKCLDEHKENPGLKLSDLAKLLQSHFIPGVHY